MVRICVGAPRSRGAQRLGLGPLRSASAMRRGSRRAAGRRLRRPLSSRSTASARRRPRGPPGLAGAPARSWRVRRSGASVTSGRVRRPTADLSALAGSALRAPIGPALAAASRRPSRPRLWTIFVAGSARRGASAASAGRLRVGVSSPRRPRFARAPSSRAPSSPRPTSSWRGGLLRSGRLSSRVTFLGRVPRNSRGRLLAVLFGSGLRGSALRRSGVSWRCGSVAGLCLAGASVSTGDGLRRAAVARSWLPAPAATCPSTILPKAALPLVAGRAWPAVLTVSSPRRGRCRCSFGRGVPFGEARRPLRRGRRLLESGAPDRYFEAPPMRPRVHPSSGFTCSWRASTGSSSGPAVPVSTPTLELGRRLAWWTGSRMS